ncbi:uncharacterized protein LOC116172972 [Photinus pyralis]|uniref:uncharacterized protein LOC116172972 n=1 Tax=Photinus pyralis TaxID=7054 RepID=UPI0012676302|nr:uncharacterized protein LOC116167599 isoform X1 [Photinus pyralis]XP_031338855.1 uncharacterized protein LOC116167599 isoform X1 [Photinus pyralis]XP_031338856.1 uncharacterized protein LOC116167599 isoform X1 [Photinus pyralis]XP_031346115.1 uncharacterized protein LOC116172972 [Photinus pyralis]
MVYLGISPNLQRILSPLISTSPNLINIKLAFNVDGLPLFKSSNVNIWPILCQIKSITVEPFVVAIFSGSGKPVPLSTYLEDFVEELKVLIHNGIEINGITISISIYAFVCDAPARSYLKGIKSHSGYSSCERCIETGDYLNGRVIFKKVHSTKRTDHTFTLQSDESHHLYDSPLVQVPGLGLVSHFAIDYMHNVCLGIMRKLLNIWISGALHVRLGNQIVKKISDDILLLSDYIPLEFNRKGRSLQDLQRWKATEFRTFLLYVSPIVLRDKLDVAMYEHFMLFHVGITILVSSSHINNIGANRAGIYLNEFANHSPNIYGWEFLIYNVHMLCHLHEDCSKYGPLDEFSAFPYENFLGKLKYFVKSPKKPLQQLCRRIQELQFLSNSFKNNDQVVPTLEHIGILPIIYRGRIDIKHFKKVVYNKCTFIIYPVSSYNSYCITKKKGI